MNVEAFLADCAEQWPTFSDPRALRNELHPRDRRLAQLPDQVPGAATENKLMLLNLAARHLGPDEVYVEIGTWCGLSLAGAVVGNEHARVYACDDFSRFWSSREELHRTIERFAAPGQVRFMEMDFRAFLRAAAWRPARVGVYFYDGGHAFQNQLDALELMEPWLADDAIVVVDDTNDLQVRAANRLFARHTPRLELVADIRTGADCQPTWWNGIQVYRYRTAAGPPGRPVSRGRRLVNRAVWNPALFALQRAVTAPRWWKHRRWNVLK
ncbi:MAG: class I SAM-dependent methyltransferase [Gemmatimonadetes bacterium]|nr:class I SAM-dependent methyltransferase [Gemmatimonadota bacterium]